MPGNATYEAPIFCPETATPGESGSLEEVGGGSSVPAPPVANFSFKASKMGA